MATVSTLFSNLRYDTGDYGGQKYSDTQLIQYLNRAIWVLDSELIKVKSNETLTSSTLTLASGADSISTSAYYDSIRALFQDVNRVYQMDYGKLLKRRIDLGSNTGPPKYFSFVDQTIQVDYTADQEYTDVYAHYDNRATVITAVGDSTPYSSKYDNYLRQALLSVSTASRDKQVPQFDQIFEKIFKDVVLRQVISQRIVRPKNRLDF